MLINLLIFFYDHHKSRKWLANWVANSDSIIIIIIKIGIEFNREVPRDLHPYCSDKDRKIKTGSAI